MSGTGDENHLRLLALDFAAATDERLRVNVRERETAGGAVVSEQATKVELFQLETPENCDSQKR